VKNQGLERTGPLGELRARPWSAVIHVPASGGGVYFKALPPALRYEAALTSTLAGWFPESVAPVLAVDNTRGWLLLPDAGTEAREAMTAADLAATWPGILHKYATLQVGCASRVDELIASGVPDRRLRHLDALLEQAMAFAERGTRGASAPPHADELRRLEDALPFFRACGERLAASGLPETIQHDDLHPANVLVGKGGQFIFDWGTAAIMHPFVGLRMALGRVDDQFLSPIEGTPAEVMPALTAYLKPWGDFAPMEALMQAYEDSTPLDLMLRFLMWERILADATDQQRVRGADSVVRLLRVLLDVIVARSRV
jgi:hypothetical protein